MADSFLTSLRSSSLSIVNTADNDKKNIAANLKISSVAIHFRSRPMRHMKEDGSSIVDARIIDPVGIDLNVICPTLDELNAVNNLLQDRKDTYTFTSKGIIVDEVSTEDVSIKQTPDMISASPVRITMKQMLRQGGATNAAVHQVVEQPADSSMFGRGIQMMRSVTTPITETFARLIKNG